MRNGPTEPVLVGLRKVFHKSILQISMNSRLTYFLTTINCFLALENTSILAVESAIKATKLSVSLPVMSTNSETFHSSWSNHDFAS